MTVMFSSQSTKGDILISMSGEEFFVSIVVSQ